MQIFTTRALHWSAVTPDTLSRYTEAWLREGTKSADYAPANLYLWNDTYHQMLAHAGEHALVRITEDGVNYRYLFPIGGGDPTPAFDALFAEAARLSQPLFVVGVTEEQLDRLPEALRARFTVSETRDYADYLYTAESLATLAGKKLHGKRNHINAFSAAHDWQVRPIAPADFPACRAIISAWREAAEFSSAGECSAALRALKAFEELSLYGALLTVGDLPVAFTVGEMLGNDTLCVHFEKTLPTWRGAYPVINREFVRMMREKHPVLTLINREDDMGLANLRAAKLSYHPTQLLRKFSLRARVL